MFRLFTPLPEVDVDTVAAQHLTGTAPLLVDVREPDEYRAGHVKASRNIPLGSLAQRIGELPTDAPVHVICRSGNRSAQAVRALNKAGLQTVNVKGGMLAWQRAGHPMRPKRATVA